MRYQFRILGKLWDFRFVPNLGKDLGWCSDPRKANKRIRVRQGLRGKERLEIVIHEATHAAFWYLDEEYVEQFAADLANILEKLGYVPDDETI